MYRKERFLTGFTLVEIMIVFAIFSIIGAAIFATLTMGRKSWHTGDVQVEMQQEVRKAMNSMVKELRQSGPAVIVGVPADGAPYSAITFQIPEDTDNDGDVIDGSGNIEWGSQITYSLGGLNGEQLLRIQSGDRVLANNIQSLQFTRSGFGEEITITLIAEKDTVFQRILTAALTSQVTLRN